MNEKLHKIDMSFEEALKRLAKTPKASIDKVQKELEVKAKNSYTKSDEPKKTRRPAGS